MQNGITERWLSYYRVRREIAIFVMPQKTGGGHSANTVILDFGSMYSYPEMAPN
jgi:hypothetical protein